MSKFIKKYYYYAYIILGAFILAFGMYNIHSRCGVTEGGIWGLELLIDHWFGISPAVTAPFLDGACYLTGALLLGKDFIVKSAVGTVGYSLFYGFLEQFPPMLPDFTATPLIAALLGALFVGVGAGFVVRQGGACAGDDALALSICKKFNCKISTAYLVTDMTVLLLSLSYIPFSKIFYSIITVLLSGKIIEIIQNWGEKELVGAVLSE